MVEPGNDVDDEAVRARLEALLDELATPGADAALERLRAIRRLRGVLHAVEARALYAARLAEHDWADIGAALGMSGQAAGKRARTHHQLDDPRPDPATGRPRRRGRYRPRRS